MAVNQPFITDNQTENAWKLEITNQINTEEARVQALVARVNSLGSENITNLETRLAEEETVSAALASNVAALTNRITLLEDRVSALEIEATTLTTGVNNLNTAISAIRSIPDGATLVQVIDALQDI